MELTLRPEVLITDAAQTYLRRGGVTNIYVTETNVQQCCIPLIAPPVVHKGIPPKPENFVPLEAAGVTVYYERNLLGPKTFTIDVQSYIFAKTLVVKGWQVKI